MKPVDSPYLVPFDGSSRITDFATSPPRDGDEKQWEKDLDKSVDKLAKLQRLLYADDRFSLLLVFQAMDAAGKDSTIRAVMSGVNPAGFQTFSFKQPSAEELDHDFLWRTASRLPERGRIGIFNRSYYEEVLVVRTHPEYLKGQKLPPVENLEKLWEERYASINSHEEHLANNGTIVLKFWLNVSRHQQLNRFIARIDEPSKNWKFAKGDVRESRLWDKYMDGYEAALNATSRQSAPWYAIPADSKAFMRMAVADIIVRTLEALPLRFPQLGKDELAELAGLRKELVAEQAALDPPKKNPSRKANDKRKANAKRKPQRKANANDKKNPPGKGRRRASQDDAADASAKGTSTASTSTGVSDKPKSSEPKKSKKEKKSKGKDKKRGKARK